MKPITDTLREIRKGRVVDDASELFAEIVRAVDRTNKPGELTIKLTVKPDKTGGRQKTLSAKISAKRPEADLPEAIFWSNADGDLLRSDPDQGDLLIDAEDYGARSRGA